MTKEQIAEKYARLESREKSLSIEEKSLEKQLDAIVKSRAISKLKKDELKKEVQIRRKLSEIYAEYDEIREAREVLDNESQNLEVEVVEEKKSNKKGIITAIIAVVLAGGLGFAAARCSKNNNCNSNQVNPDKSISITTDEPLSTDAVITPVITMAPTATPEPTVAPVLVDVTNDEDVAKAAARVMTEDVNVIVEAENDVVFANSFNNETIEDIIRVVNGELPKYSQYDDYTIGETANMMNDILANRGSVGNTLYPVHFSKLYPDGSREAEYVETYDVIYNNIAKYRAEGNVDGVIEQVGLLGSKLYNEWHLAGLYGGYNPYLFPAEEHYFLLQASTSRFPNYVREYLEANDLTVCIQTCYNPETQEYKLVEVRDIFEAMYMGTSKNGEISVLRSGEVINIFGETYQDLKQFLDTKAQENVKVLR